MNDVVSILSGILALIFIAVAITRSLNPENTESRRQAILHSPVLENMRARAEQARLKFEAEYLPKVATTFDLHFATILESPNIPLVEGCKGGEGLYLDAGEPGLVRVCKGIDIFAGPIGYLNSELSALVRNDVANGRIWHGVFEIDEGEIAGVRILILRFNATATEAAHKANEAKPQPELLLSSQEAEQLANRPGVGHA